jgi:glycosyltransferase involved in cell wall biosynthesis
MEFIPIQDFPEELHDRDKSLLGLGFWFENSGISSVDLSEPLHGNPGVGGTEYQFVLIANFFLAIKRVDVEITFFLEKHQDLPKDIKQIVVRDLPEAYEKSAEQGIDFLIFRPRRNISDEIRNLAPKKTMLIPWLHITPKREYLDWLAETSIIHRVIFVGDDQRMRTIDHRVYRRSSTIYNTSTGFFQFSTVRRSNLVVYVGALVPRKGFHILAKAWPKVREQIPNAELHVLGSGDLYDKETQLGPLQLAEAIYEEKFVGLLGGESGLEGLGVHFLGTLGKEKANVIESAAVGVVNPSGLTENCPMSVVEFYQSGIPVVSSNKYGMRDMIISGKTGILCRSYSQLGDVLIRFLEGSENSERLGSNGIEFAKVRFSPEKIVEDWMRVLLGDFIEVPCLKGYWLHKFFAKLKRIYLLPNGFAMVEDQKIYLARIREKFLRILR